jgi:hypothetical protein
MHTLHSLFLAQKSNQNTWLSDTLDFSLVFRWVSAFFLPYAHSQSFLRNARFLVLADFFLNFLKTRQLLGFLGFVYIWNEGQTDIFLFSFLVDVLSMKEDIT